jgi:hypothetical protein
LALILLHAAALSIQPSFVFAWLKQSGIGGNMESWGDTTYLILIIIILVINDA